MEKKGAYPIVLKRTDEGYYVVIPDFDIGTQGSSVAEAMEMARDAIGLMGIDLEDAGRELPSPYSGRIESEKDDIVTLVDIDFSEYRKKVDNRAIKKNCTIPYWMSVEADKAGINYSRLLQDAISNVLGIRKSIN
nr:MAG TPA: antitoxin [Caudoviricetes sp.]